MSDDLHVSGADSRRKAFSPAGRPTGNFLLKRVFLAILLLMSLQASAQQDGITGRVVDKESREALSRATLKLYRPGTRDTTFVTGATAGDDGHFTIGSVAAGTYLLRVSYLGYKELSRQVTKQRGQRLALGEILMETDAVQLEGAQVTANIPKMVVKDDTLVYNADAFRVPEGSVIEALVEALPGAKIDDDGAITINGKSVKKFKMDGRDFMTGNNDAVMKNLPSYVIDKVKAYDEKSDLSRMTNIDDGEDDFVLEFVTKRSARNGLQMNPDVGIGTDGRYGIRLTAMKPFGAMRYTFMGNANNVNDRNFSGRGGRGRGNNNGQRTTKTGALDISYENDKNLKTSGRVTWTRNDADNWNRTASESFVATRGGSFSNSVSQSYSRNNSWTGNMNLQWEIDKNTTLSFRPNVSFSTNDSRSFSNSATFSDDPYNYVTNPLSPQDKETMDELGLIVNGEDRKSMGYGTNNNVRSQLQVYRRMGDKGRNVALSSNINYSSNNNRNANLSAVRLFQTFDKLGNDSTYQTNRYTVTPSHNFSFSAGLTYTEPLFIFKPKPEPADTAAMQGPWGMMPGMGGMMPGMGGGMPAMGGAMPAMGGGMPAMGGGNFAGGNQGGGNRGGQGGRGGRRGGQEGVYLQMNYNYTYSFQKNDPSTYDFPDYSDDAFSQVLQEYRDWARLFGYLNNPYESYVSQDLSRYSERTEYNHNIDLQLRVNRQKYNVNAGVQIQPQKSHYIQQYLGQPVDTVRTVTNLSPTMNLRYRFNEQTNLQVTLRGQTQQPNITQLLDIYDDTQPLNITMGNPGLKPAFTSNLNANFQMMRRYKLQEDSLGFMVPKAQRHWSFNANGSFQRTRNSIGNVVTYNETTGGRISRPENINGNWSANGGATFNIGLDTLNRWDVSGSVRGSYNHRIGYVNLKRTAIPERNVTHTYNLTPSLSLSFRNKWLNFSLNANTTYAHTENKLQASNNLTTWNFTYGGNTRITFPWGSDLSTDIHVYSKRGYSDQTLNTDEVIWNAQLSHAFLKGKKLVVMLQWYDILHQQSNFTRNVTANGWTDREVNAITSYAMLHVSYRLNLFGGNNQGGQQGQQGRGRGFGRGFGGGGFPGGGFGGGGFGGGFPGGGPQM